MIDHGIHNDDDADRKSWSAPRLRSIVPARRTRGGSGEQNGKVDDIVYALSCTARLSGGTSCASRAS